MHQLAAVIVLCMVLTGLVDVRCADEKRYDWDPTLSEDIQTYLSLIQKDRVLDRNRAPDGQGKWGFPTAPRLTAWSWEDCGGLTDLVAIGNLSVTPDPIKLPGAITVSVAAKIKENIDEPIEASLVIRKKLGIVWIEIPCIDNVGSCKYTSICSMLANVTCPAAVVKIGQNCRCPIKKSDGFEMPPTVFTINTGKDIPTGDYEIQANVTRNSMTVPVVCLKIMFSIQH